MPIYEYQCGGCQIEFEEWQKITDKPVRTCPSCGKRRVKRLVSRSAFHLKGDGWYVTDYGNRKNGSSDGGTGGADSAKPAKTGGADSAKPAKSDGKKSPSKSDGAKSSAGSQAAA